MPIQIIKHEIEPALHAPTIIKVPKHSKLLKVHSSNGEHIFAFFMENNKYVDKDVYYFYTIPTDWKLNNEHPIIAGMGASVNYINSVFINDGEHTFHVFVGGPYIHEIT